MSSEILNIEALNKSFVNTVKIFNKNKKEKNFIINDFDMFVPRNSISALIGGNGAGKTTLFNIISGFMKPDSGEINYYITNNGKKIEPLIDKKPHEITKLGIGRMFQDTHIFPEMTVLENMMISDEKKFGENPYISLFLQHKLKKIENERKKEAEEIFKELFGYNNHLWAKRNDLASTLSYGQQRLLALARLFMGEYKLILLDEPTSGVNPKLILKILVIIKKLNKEKNVTILLIEHNMKVVMEIADFCNFMSHGKRTAFGTPEDVLGDDTVRKNYLGI